MKKQRTVALFGEAEKGDFETPYFCRSLEQLIDYCGNPPQSSQGIALAIQTLLFEYHLIFLRVAEEGFSEEDYYRGLHTLEKQELLPIVSAICLPGVGKTEIIQAVTPLCIVHHNLLITTEADLYDYLTAAA